MKSKTENRKSKIAWSVIRLFAMDVDGVLTDGTILVGADGTEAKTFSILDGHGLKQLAKAGVAIAWISGRSSGATAVRARELGIPHLVQGRVDKRTALMEIARSLDLDNTECAYMGDDVIDIPAIKWAGIGIAPPGAMDEALAAARHVTRRAAGFGAVREVCDLILSAKTPEPRNNRASRRTKRR